MRWICLERKRAADCGWFSLASNELSANFNIYIYIMNRKEIIIIGGGLSGLMAAWQLSRAGVPFTLLEGRPRFGGRAWTIHDAIGADSDLGPSWFWPGQPLIASLLDHFGIGYYEQYADGMVLVQQPDGKIGRAPIDSPMAGALRIEGGVRRLVEALIGEIDPAHLYAAHTVTELTIEAGRPMVVGTHQDKPFRLSGSHVALAIPPRLGAKIDIYPSLPQAAVAKLEQTPTWMAGHAKLFAVYPQPFWRQRGFSGTVMSRQGPLGEIHDASPKNDSVFSLFGFFSLNAAQRFKLGEAELTRLALQQLASLFGDQALAPKAVYFKDWSREPFTAAQMDKAPPVGHPAYGLTLQFGEAWEGRLTFISAETEYANGGLIEGALTAGLRYAQRFIDQATLDQTERDSQTAPLE